MCLLLLSAFPFVSQPLTATPRLTVFVLVDGMSSESLQILRPYWSKGGLRTIQEEAFQTQVTFPHLVYGGDETTATLLTGLTPSEHGYAMDRYFDRTARSTYSLLQDDQYPGIGTTLSLSPRALLSPTIADLVRLRHGDKSKIYAVGIRPSTTLLLAGHSANACCWIDTKSLSWAASSYYSEGLPSPADEQNVNGRFLSLASRVWTPRMDIASYMRPTDRERKKSFEYTASKVLDQCPVANTLVIELALALQDKQHLGTDNIPDLLLLQLTTQTPNAQSDHIRSAEQEDLYLSLNQDLGFLIEQLDKRLGRAQYEILLVGRPLLGEDKQDMQRIHLPVERFNVDRAAALTATYLMALYGHERWVDGGWGNSIFLNRTLIEQKRLSLLTIQDQVANFLMDFEGVQMALPQREAMLHPTLSPSLNKHVLGDVFFTLQSGYQLYSDDQTPLDHVLSPSPSAPLLLYSSSLRPMPQGPIQATQVIDLIAY